MDCKAFRDNWTEWHEGWLADDGGAMRAHRDACAGCARFDGQMRAMVDGLADLPLADEPAAAAPKDGVAGRTWWGRWAALAATLVVGVAAGVLLSGSLTPASNGPTIQAETVSIDSTGVHEVAVAFESPREVTDVQFAVELPPGVELAGSPGERAVRWQGRLAKGATRLRLPLRIQRTGDLGSVVARVEHPTGVRELVIPLRMAAGSGSDDTA
jgi:hypothetical protein